MQIAGDENDPRRLGHLLDHEIRQEEMTEKVQLKSTLKAVFAELQRFGFHVDAAGVQDESVNGRNAQCLKFLRQAANGRERKQIQWREAEARSRMCLANVANCRIRL